MSTPRPKTRPGEPRATPDAGETQSTERLLSLSQRMLDFLALPISYFDRQQRVRFANAAYLECVGLDLAGVLGQPVADVIGHDVYPLYRAYAEAALAGEYTGFERQLTTPGQAPRWVRVDYHPDRDREGAVRGVIVTYIDVDNLKQLELEAGERERWMRLVTDSIGAPVFYCDRQSRLRFANQPFGAWLGVAAEDLLGRRLDEVFGRDVIAPLGECAEQAYAGRTSSCELRLRRADGPLRWVRVGFHPDGDPSGDAGGAFVVVNDIDDDIRIRETLRAQEQQLRLFADNIPEPVVYIDATGRYSFANEAFLALTGLGRDQVLGRRPFEVIGSQLDLGLRPESERAFTGETVAYERVLRDAHGRERCLRGRMVPDQGPDGTIRGLYVVAHDITDLREVQQALAARESQLRAIMDGVPAPVAYLDRDERCRYVNRALRQYFGRTSGEASTLTLRDVIGENIYQSARPLVARALAGEPTAFDRLVPGAGGARRWMTLRVVPDAAPQGAVNGVFVLMHDVHGLKQAQEALRASESELRLIMDNVPARVAYVDCEYRLRFVNRHNEEWLRVPRHELAGRSLVEAMGERRSRQLAPMLQRVLDGEVVSAEALLAQPHGDDRWEAVHFAPNRDAAGAVLGIYAVHTDIHDQKMNEDALRRANRTLSSHISNTPLAVLEWDRDSRLVRWSPQAEHIFGWRADEVLGMAIDANPLVHDADRETIVQILAKLTGGEQPRATGLTRNHRKDGGTIWCEWYYSCLQDDDGRTESILSFVQDVSARIRAEERLQYLATRDTLTGLPNRLLLHERLAQAIAKAKRSGHRVGVLFIDLDRFKNVNDTLGHRIGDELLKLVTQALAESLRETDLLARLGGDEFMVIVEDVDRTESLGRVAQKLLDAVAQPFMVEEHDIFVTSSIGISVYPDDSDDPDELLKHADVAMYRSKELGRNTFQFLDADLAARRTRQHTLETALRAAIKSGRLSLHYQPILEVGSRRIVGAEALLRWDDPEHGSVPPRVFVPLAEESGLIHALGEWVVREAARQCAAWRRAGLALDVSINLSARQFYREDLPRLIADIVRGEDCLPAWLELEVTETSLLHDVDAMRKLLQELRNEGFAVAIDDFGTGYSSLTHLKHFPIDTLKIDISFIADIETDPGDAAITEAIIGLARGLGLTVVAEGVETDRQLAFLAEHGCHLFQGYWAARPLPAAQLQAFAAASVAPAD